MLKVVGNESAQDEVDGRSLLDEIAREGARRMLVAALETEVVAYLEAHGDERDGEGHALVVRNGKGRTRKITLGVGTIPIRAPRVNDRRINGDGERSRFTSRILPLYMRRSPKDADVLLTFFEFPGEHWKHLRTSNVIESPFATVRLRQRDEGRGLTDEGPLDGLQAPRHGAGQVATARRGAPPAARAGRHRLRGRRAAGGKGNRTKARAA